MDSTLTLQDLLTEDPPGFDELDQRILRAALTLFTRVGIKRASTDDIARHAQINRTTLHRRMGPKHQLTRTAITYECRRVLAHIAGQLDPTAALSDRIAHGFVLIVPTIRAHPLLRQALAADPDDTLLWLTRDGGDILTLATDVLATHIRQTWSATPDTATVPDPRPVAAILIRLVHSLILTPDAPPHLRTNQDLWDFARTHLMPPLERPRLTDN